MNHHAGAWLKAFLAALLFGISTPISKVLLNEMQPFMLAALFYLGTAAALMPASLALQLKSPVVKLTSSDRLHLWGSLFFGGMAGPVLLLYGLQKTTATDAALLLNLETPATAALAYLFFKEHISKIALTANVGILLAGIMLAFQGTPNFGIGALLIAAACIAWGLDNNHTASIHSLDAVRCTFLKGAVFGSVNLLIAIWSAAAYPSWRIVMITLFVGAICYGLSIVLYISAAREMGAARSQMVFASAPFFGVAMAQIFLGEGLQNIQIFSTILLIGMLILLYVEQHSHHHDHLPIKHDHRHNHDDEHHRHEHTENEVSGKTVHSHIHKHPRLRHRHMHLPDVHHRHEH